MNNNAEQDENVPIDQLVSIIGIGVWTWDIPGDCIRYNEEYAGMLGFSCGELNGSLEQWKALLHPLDLSHAVAQLNSYLLGEIPRYECEVRLRHKDGSHIWVRDAGRISAYDSAGRSVQMIGGCVRIDQLKHSENS